MKKALAVIALIVLNALAFSAGVWAVFGSWSFSVGKIDLLPSILFIAALPSPLVFVWRFFRDRFDLGKGKFFLCTLLPPYIVTAAVSLIMLTVAAAEDSGGGWGGLAALALAFSCHAAKIGLIIGTVAWVDTCDKLRIRSERLKKTLAIVLLTVCGVFILGKLHGLLDLNPLSNVYTAVVYVIGTKPPIVSHITGTLAAAVILAVPIGAGASALMRAFRKEYSVKAPVFMICAFLPTLLISGGLTAARYFNDRERYFYYRKFTDSLDALLFTALIAVMSAIIYAVSSAVIAIYRQIADDD